MTEYQGLQDLFLLASALLCTLCFGFVLLFTIVVMPGLEELDNGSFLQAFQVIDGVIQRGQPIFVFVWIGSIAALLGTLGLTLSLPSHNDSTVVLFLLVPATIAYIVGQVTTFTINIPLNNRVQTLNIPLTDDMSRALERERFERMWNFSNQVRTVLFGFASLLLLAALLIQDASIS